MAKHTTAVREGFDELLQMVKDFMQAEVFPLEQQFSPHDFKKALPTLHKKRALVKKMGLLTPQIPVEYGGAGLSMWEHGLLSSIIGQSPFGFYVFNAQAPDAGNMEVLIEYGNDAQRKQYLEPMSQGKIRSCFSMTERDHAGSNPLIMTTNAVKDGDDYVINGHKWFTSSADGATFAIVMLVTNPEAERLHHRASMVIVPMNTPGVHIVRNISVMGHPGNSWASHSEITYTNVRVPQANLIGKEGSGFAIAQGRLGPGRIHHCMRWMGICDRAFDMMCRYAAKRPIGQGEMLASKQTIQNWIAESQADIKAAKLMILDTAKKIDAEGVPASKIEISTIKFFCAGVLGRVLDRALQTHGALGMTDDILLAHWYSHERAARIYDGPDEVHKSSVAKQILKGYGF
jgi:alkylation response protein AidB-like acyl-CoA dehydrogenase